MLNFAKCDPKEKPAIGRNFREILKVWIDLCGSETREAVLKDSLKSA